MQLRLINSKREDGMSDNFNSAKKSDSYGHNFGGTWTAEKLSRVSKYLAEYSKIMAKKNFSYAYIDAFAGTGYISKEMVNGPENSLFLELAGEESQSFIDGSVKTALEISPPFTEYIFIEKYIDRIAELKKTCEEYPDIASRISIENAEANSFLQDLCDNRNWKSHRAVLFLDPYGMQVEWQTIESIAHTKAIDMWLLFPLGMSINRLLRKNGEIPMSWERKLDRFFGTHEWKEAFYEQQDMPTLFGEETELVKSCSFEAITKYFVDRLKLIFPYVADNPLTLCNSKNNPLFLLCFAAGNEKGGKIAKRIAEFILKK